MSQADTGKLRALCTEPENYSEAGLEAAAQLADLDIRSVRSDELAETIGDYDLLFVRLKTFVGADALNRAERLKAIVTPTTGLNHLDLETAAVNGIEVFHLKGQVDFLKTVTSTAEHTWALLLALYRHIPVAAKDVLAGHWRQDEHRGRELQDKSLGILGFGRLGRIVAEYGRVFGMSIFAHDHNFENAPPFLKMANSIDDLLRVSDVFTIHIPLSAETRGLIGGRELSKLPEGAVLINTSRGEIIDDDALISALESGRLAGAAVDVINNERDFPSSKLIDYARSNPNLIITPHIGGATYEAVEKTDLFVIDRLRNWLEHSG